jgi:5-dehydro-2-deoxygluconokinase
VNVAVGLARLGVETAIVSRVGSDGHGEFVRRFLTDERVDVGWLGTDLQYRTPLTFCEVWPPDRFPLTFYRQPTAPDWELTAESLDVDAIAGIPLLFASATGLARSPSREATMVALEAHRGTTVLDLDWRPSLWAESEEYAGLAREAARRVDVVVGTEGEFVGAAGEPDPEPAALALLEAGPSLAVIKRGAKGAIALEDGRRVESPGVDVEVVNGLGAGDAFAAGLGRVEVPLVRRCEDWGWRVRRVVHGVGGGVHRGARGCGRRGIRAGRVGAGGPERRVLGDALGALPPTRLAVSGLSQPGSRAGGDGRRCGEGPPAPTHQA